MNTQPTSKIESLQSYLTRIANSLHYRYYRSVPADDILQEMNLHILECAAKDPSFLDQADGYITRAAAWHARSWLSPERKGANYAADREGYSLDSETPEGIARAETIADELPDQDVQIAVRAALDTLDGVSRDLAGLLLQGRKMAQAARELGISPQLANHFRKPIVEALAPVWASL